MNGQLRLRWKAGILTKTMPTAQAYGAAKKTDPEVVAEADGCTSILNTTTLRASPRRGAGTATTWRQQGGEGRAVLQHDDDFCLHEGKSYQRK